MFDSRKVSVQLEGRVNLRHWTCFLLFVMTDIMSSMDSIFAAAREVRFVGGRKKTFGKRLGRPDE